MNGVIDCGVSKRGSCLFYVDVLNENEGGQVEMGSFLKGLRLIGDRLEWIYVCLKG
jgi:hypothetical protein